MASTPDIRPAGASTRPRLATWLLRTFLWTLLSSAVALCLIYGVMRFYLLPSVDQWRPNIQAAIARWVDRPLTIGRLSAAMDGLRPSLTVHDLLLGAADESPLKIETATAVLSLRALIAGRLDLLSLDLSHPRLVVERISDRRLRVAGGVIDLDANTGDTDLALFLAPRLVSVRHAELEWIDRVNGSSTRLDEVAFSLSHHGAAYQAVLRIPSISDAFRGLSLRGSFVLDPDEPADWRRWEGEGEIAATHVDFPALDSLIRSTLAVKGPSPVRLAEGGGQVSASARFAGGRLDDLLTKAQAESVVIAVAGKTLPLRSLALEAVARRESDGAFAVNMRNLQVSDGAGLTLALRGSDQRVLFDAERLSPVAGELSFAEFDAAQFLNALKRMPLPANWMTELAALTASGRITQTSLQWRLDPVSPRFAAALSFERLSLRRVIQRPRPGQSQWPAFTGLTGRAEFDDQGGRMSINATNTVLRFPGVFADPALGFDSLEAVLGWRNVAPKSGESVGQVDVSIELLRFANADMAGELTGTYRSGGRGAGLVDLRGQLERANVARVGRYLPLVISPAVRGWVGRAVQGGRTNDTRFVLRGDLFDFPFRQPDSGEFRIESHLRDAVLAYAQGWPAVRQIQGSLIFERAGMDVTAESAQIYDVRLGRTRARIADFANPTLQVDGNGEGPAQDMIRFVNESPLKSWVDDFVRGARVQGDAALNLQMQMPIAQPDKVKVKGGVLFSGNEASIIPLLPPLDNVKGQLEFSETGIRLRDMEASFLGGELRAQGGSLGPSRYRIDARGSLDAATLGKLWPHPFTQAISGQTTYQAQLDVELGQFRLALQSDLVGMVSALPPPFAKQASARWPLRVKSGSQRLGTQPALRHEVSLRNDLKAVIEHTLESAGAQRSAFRGALAINAEPVLREDGLNLVIQLPGVELDAWSDLIGGMGGGGARAPWQPRAISLITEELSLGGKTLKQVNVSADYREEAWRGTIRSQEMEGRFTWRDAAAGQDAGSLEAVFKRLEIPRSQAEGVEALFMDHVPRTLPALAVSAERFVLFGRELGKLSLRALNEGSGRARRWRLDRLELDHPGGAFNATGQWGVQTDATLRATDLSFVLKLSEPARWLSSFGIRDAITGGAGQIEGRLRWSGSPLALDYPSLGGELRMSLGKGQFLKTEPGLAKLIGVLNLQSLPRRLSLDFRDVFAEGFAFDEIRGVAKIDGGVAATDDLRMRGPQAQVAIRGEANLAAETQQLTVQVKPELNAGLASLAYAAMANPMIGFGSFLAQLALRKPLQELFRYEYEVLGTWADPTVIERSRPRFEQLRQEFAN